MRGHVLLSLVLTLASPRLCLAQANQPPSTSSSVSSPLSPEDSLKHLRLLPGLKLELAAREPEIVDPVAMRFDEQGRLWVVEMRDYPHGPAEGEEPQSVIKTLEDRDGDGRFETATVFADKLLFATGLQPWRGGVIVTLAGEVAYLRDMDGDGRMDQRETWYTGFAQENSQLRANHPHFGLNNHIYISNGLRGGSVVNARNADSQPVVLNGKDFRFHPTTFVYEALTGVGQFGLTFDDFGHRFVCSNRNPLIHIVLEDRYIRRNPHYAPAAAVHDVAKAGADSRIFPLSRAWTTSNLHAGQFTAACGCLIFRGSGLPARFLGNSFTCDPTGNLVHRELLSRHGPTFDAVPDRDGEEFLASTDEWFRPVNLADGPDGALYVVDMYRAVIEHPQFMPDELKERPDLLLGTDRGRIYRITAVEDTKTFRWPKLGEMSSQSLVGLFEHPNAWQRETAARLLFERQDQSVTPRLRSLVVNGSHAAARVQALWTLHGLQSLTDDTLLAALHDAEPDVRAQGIAAAEDRLAASAPLRKRVLELAGDEFAPVRFQAALSLAPIQNADEVAALTKILLIDPSDEWTRRAVAIASGDQAVDLLEGVLAQPPWAGGAPRPAESALVNELVALAAGSPTDGVEQRVLTAILDLTKQAEASELQRTTLLTFAKHLGRRRTDLAAAIQKLPDAMQRQEIIGLLEAAAQIARDSEQEPAARGEALELLAYEPTRQPLLAELALGEPVQAVRVRAIAALGRHADLEPWKQLFAAFPSLSPTIRLAVVDAGLANEDRTSLLLDAIFAGAIGPAELDRTHVNRLLNLRDAKLKARAAELLASAVPADRQQVLAEYQPVLKMKSDPVAGRQVFAKNCANCHRIGDLGVNVAPDISDSRVKQPEQLLTDILQPNRAIDNNFVSYTVVTTDGLVLTGIITADTAASVTLQQPEGKTATLLRSEIDELRSNGVSLMPEGLEKNVPPQDMADLIAFIKNWRYLDGRTPLGSAAP